MTSRVHLMLQRNELDSVLSYLGTHGPTGCSYVSLPLEDSECGSSTPARHEVALQSAEVLFTGAPQLGSSLYGLPALRWTHINSAGVNLLMKHYRPEQPEPAMAVTRFASTAFARELAEWVLMAVLSHERRLPLALSFQRRRRWTHSEMTELGYRSLRELTVAVMGTGRMGSEVGAIFKQLGCTVYGFARTEKPPSPHFDKIFTPSQLCQLLDTADYVCNLLPSTAATHHLLTADLLRPLADRRRRPPPVLVNAGRGDVIGEADLVEALRRGWLSGAVLDVFEEEPLPQESPLWEMEQVTITPHIGNINRPEVAAAAFLDNLQRFLQGEPLLNKVSWLDGY